MSQREGADVEGTSRRVQLTDDEIEAALQRAADELNNIGPGERLEAGERPGRAKATPPPPQVSERSIWEEMPPETPPRAPKPRAGYEPTPARKAAPAQPPALSNQARALQKTTSKTGALTPFSERTGLQAQMRSDSALQVRGQPWLRAIGLAVLIGGLVSSMELDPVIAFSIAGGGAVLFLLGLIGRSRVGLKWSGTQKTELRRLKGQILMWRGGVWAGAGIAVAAALLGALDILASTMFAIAAAALAFAIFSYVRLPSLTRLYAQTMVLAHLETMPIDGRLPLVMKALDALLGTVPESAMRRFSGTSEASMYLEIIDALEDQ